MSTSSLFPNVSSPRVSAWAPSSDPRSWVQAGIALSITLLLVIFLPLHAIAENVTLAWDSNSEPDLAGYILYHKKQASVQYLDSVVVGNTTSYTMSGLDPGHTYDFVVTAFDESGNESDFSAPVSASIPFSVPVAAFSPSATSGTAPLAVSFTDASTGNITAWAWTFGDGSTSADQHPSHTYAAGTYTVSLTVTGPGGAATATNAITVTDPPPPVSSGGGETSTSTGSGETSTSTGGGGTSTSTGGGGTSTSTGGGGTSTSPVGGGTSTTPLTADFDLISTRDEVDPNTANTGATLTASLANTRVTLTVSRDGTGSGVVRSDAVGIDCGGDCSAELPIGTLVTLIATPEDRSIFTGWNNVECAGTDSCTFPAEFSGMVTATFRSEGTADGPDLTGTITKFRRKVNSDGDKAVLKVTIENLGTVPADPFSTALFVSDDMVWDAGDAQVATVAVKERLLPGERVSVKLKSPRLANLVGKFMLTVIDVNNDVEESAEVNNILVRKLEGVPDLMPTITKFKHKEGLDGDKLVVALNVRNRGTAAASEFTPIDVAVFLSDDATLDPGDERLATATIVDGVAPGKKSGVIKLKRKGLPPMAGKFVIVVVDVDDGVFEANEGNNTLVVPIAAPGTS